ncbi:hypothetical protein Hanom_Chr05g00413131 [Helianthus anomalus]
MTKPQEFWKPKIVVLNQKIQKETHFYKRGTPKGKTWSVKKQEISVRDEKVEVKTWPVKKKRHNFSFVCFCSCFVLSLCCFPASCWLFIFKYKVILSFKINK